MWFLKPATILLPLSVTTADTFFKLAHLARTKVIGKACTRKGSVINQEEISNLTCIDQIDGFFLPFLKLPEDGLGRDPVTGFNQHHHSSILQDNPF